MPATEGRNAINVKHNYHRTGRIQADADEDGAQATRAGVIKRC